MEMRETVCGEEMRLADFREGGARKERLTPSVLICCEGGILASAVAQYTIAALCMYSPLSAQGDLA